jgi:hypothetical protein
MVNEAFVRQYLAGQLRSVRASGSMTSKPELDYEIVGVLADAQFHDPKQADCADDVLCRCCRRPRSSRCRRKRFCRPRAPRRVSANEVRRARREVDGNLPLSDPRTAPRSGRATAFGSSRLAAALRRVLRRDGVGCSPRFGLFGVVSQAVARRTTEIGVRLALGAQRTDVLWMVFRDTDRARRHRSSSSVCRCSFAAARLIASQLFGLGPIDLWSTALSVLTLVAIAGSPAPFRQAGVARRSDVRAARRVLSREFRFG